MYPNIQASKIQCWWRYSITNCTGCGVYIPRDKSGYQFNKCTICYHDKYSDRCGLCAEGKIHNWGYNLTKKYERSY